MDNLIDPPTLAELLGVSIHDLRNWRRLPTDHPRHIASTVKDCRHHFASPDIIDFLRRNADMAERVAGLFAEPTLVLALKGYTPPPADTPVDHQAWATLHTIEQTPQLETHKENPL